MRFSSRVFLILAALVGVGAFLLFTDYWVATPQHLEPKPIPAFYAGGLKQGSGGQLEYGSVKPADLFLPSPARNSSNVLLPNKAFPDPNACGSCHVGIHDAWSQSLHAKSATDELYLKVKEQFVVERGEPAVRLCAACHAPVALMTGEVGLYNRESVSSQQGVSCGFCHSLESVHSDSGGWLSNPARVRGYVGGNVFAAGNNLAKVLLNAKPRVHQQDMFRPVLSSGEVCRACHEFSINNVLVQSTWSEFKASSFAAKGVSCQSCHFSRSGAFNALEPGEVALGRSKPSVQWHRLLGGSTIVAANPDANLANLKNALKLEGQLKSGTLEVRVFNVGAAHAIPTGVADLRELWLEVRGLDVSGRTVFSSGVLDAAGVFKAETRVFHQVLQDENSNPIVRHDIWRAKRIALDTRIPAGGSRLETFRLPKSVVKTQVRLLWRDVPSDFNSWVLGSGDYQKSARVLRILQVLR
jgi:Cytochrome c554 and c-prime